MTADLEITHSVLSLLAGFGLDGSTEVASDLSRLSILDCIGVSIAAAGDPLCVMLEAGAADGTQALATIWQSGRRVPLPDAVVANALSAHALDYDALLPRAYAQPSAVLVPVVLGIGETLRCPARKLVAANLLGMRVMDLLGSQFGARLHGAGWHPTSLLGTVASAAAAAWLQGLDRPATMNSIGIAASLASGLKVNFGTETKKIQVADAARRGAWAAELASRGVTASPHTLEGWFTALLGNPDPVAGAGDHVPDLHIKKYPSCGRMHAALDAILEMQASRAPRPGLIDRIECHLNPADISHIDRRVAETADQARFSLQYCAAAAVLFGRVTLTEFAVPLLSSADLAGVMRRVAIVADEAVPSFGARVLLGYRDGDHLEHAVPAPRPATSDDVRQKFMDCCRQARLEPAQADAIADCVLELGSGTDDGRLYRLLGARRLQRSS